MPGQDVGNNIKKIYGRKRVAVYALCLRYAALALKEFRQKQRDNAYWTNRTYNAFNLVFSNAFKDGDVVGFFIAHAVEYGVSLELANNRRHAALRPITNSLLPDFRKDLAYLMGETDYA